MITDKRVAVIGAGPSGLVATKELMQEGLTPTCFEAGHQIGGIFHYEPAPGRPSVWNSCRLSSSSYVTSFSDYFPDEHSSQPFPHRQLNHDEYLDYLHSYATHFQLWPHIRLRSRVLRVARKATSWAITVSRPDGISTHEFDAVAICTGVHTRPFVPPIDGLELFEGQVLHSADYRDATSVKGSRVLFVGAGESGAEIVDEASYGRQAAYLSLRRNVWVLPRIMRGYPNDYFGTRLIYSLPDFLVRRSDAQSTRLRRWYALITWPVRVVPRIAQRLLTGVSVWRNRATESSRAVKGSIMRMRGDIGATQFESFATKSDAFLQAIEDGRCELRPEIASFGPRSVTFGDGTSAEIDAVVFCTGFEPASIPCLDEAVDFSSLYLRCFTPRYRETLALIGFLRPAIGAIPPLAEMQARLWASALTGRVEIPSSDHMADSAAREYSRQSEEFEVVHPRLPHQVDFSAYLDELAEMLQCKPTLRRLSGRIWLLPRLYLSPFSAVQYRLVGPHSRPSASRRLMKHVPMHGSTLRVIDLVLTSVLYAFRIDRFRPHLTLEVIRGMVR
jgi:dimethylaniline monooxygenase (N-oxide forming)